MSGSLGSGAVNYSVDRPIIHFATPPAQIEARIAADRLRAKGFLLDVSGKGYPASSGATPPEGASS